MINNMNTTSDTITFPIFHKAVLEKQYSENCARSKQILEDFQNIQPHYLPTAELIDAISENIINEMKSQESELQILKMILEN